MKDNTRKATQEERLVQNARREMHVQIQGIAT